MAEMEDDGLLAHDCWAAINLHNMTSRAWSHYFAARGLKSEDYRQLIDIIMAHAVLNLENCTPTRIAKIASTSFQLNEKTVMRRIDRLIDVGLLEETPHPIDRRKKILAPTKILRESYKGFNERVISISCLVADQAAQRIGPTGEIQVLSSNMQFDIFERIKDKASESGKSAKKRG